MMAAIVHLIDLDKTKLQESHTDYLSFGGNRFELAFNLVQNNPERPLICEANGKTVDENRKTFDRCGEQVGDELSL